MELDNEVIRDLLRDARDGGKDTALGLSGLRVLEALRAALAGQVPIQPVHGPVGKYTLWEVGHGLVTVDIDDLRVCFYIDDGFLDYCEWAVDKAGQRGNFERWSELGTEPVAQLSQDDQKRLLVMIEAAD
jgi:hypothetical protein